MKKIASINKRHANLLPIRKQGRCIVRHSHCDDQLDLIFHFHLMVDCPPGDRRCDRSFGNSERGRRRARSCTHYHGTRSRRIVGTFIPVQHSRGETKPKRASMQAFEPLLEHIDFKTVCACRCVCKEWYEILVTLEKHVANTYATKVLGDVYFWENALRRPAETSMPLNSWQDEMKRITHFQECFEINMPASDFYRLWEVIDGKKYEFVK